MKRRHGSLTRLFIFALVFALLLAPVMTATVSAEPGGEGIELPTPEPRPFPAWMMQTGNWPIWIYTVDEFPDWFYELEREPVWFHELDTIPSWFYTLKEIPDWFYADPEEPAPERELPLWLQESMNWPEWLYEVEYYPDWFYELEKEPVWFRDSTEEPPWFYTLTEIPDWFYEEPITEDELEDESEDIYYPPGFAGEELFFTFELAGGVVIYCTVPGGMVTNSDVRIDFPTDSYVLKLDDIPVGFALGEPLTEHGSYTLAPADNLNVSVFSFRIIKRPINEVIEFTPPEGFELTGIYLGEDRLRIDDPGKFETLWEGDYRFVVGDSAKSGRLPLRRDLFTVDITLDRTPPQLVFTNAAEHEDDVEIFEISPEGTDELLAPIHFYIADDEENCDITVTLGGTVIHPNRNTLTEAGLYRVSVRDEAGNAVEYVFRILYVMNVPTVWVIVIAALAVTGLGAYLVRYRMTVRVR